jgi:hypothetical protein
VFFVCVIQGRRMLDAVASASARILILQLNSILFSLTHRFVYELQLFTERTKGLGHLPHMFSTVRPTLLLAARNSIKKYIFRKDEILKHSSKMVCWFLMRQFDSEVNYAFNLNWLAYL